MLRFPIRNNELISTIVPAGKGSLKELEAHHIIERIQYSEVSPHVEYFLTEKGLKLLPALYQIKEWGIELLTEN